MPQKKDLHPDTVLHLEPKGEPVHYKGKTYAATLQVKAGELDAVEGDYEVTREVPNVPEPPAAA
jgi:hypothetical protein